MFQCIQSFMKQLSVLCAMYCSRHLECISKQKEKQILVFLEYFVVILKKRGIWKSEKKSTCTMKKFPKWLYYTPSPTDPNQVENYSTGKHYNKTTMKAKILNIIRVIHKTHYYIFLCKFLLVFSSNWLTLSLDSSSRNIKSFILFSFSVFWSNSSDT